MMGPKMGPIFFRDLAIKSDPRRFLTSYWYHWIGNFGPDHIREGPGVILGPRKEVKVGRKVPKMTKKMKIGPKMRSAGSFFWLTRDQIYFCRIEGIKIRPRGSGRS